MTNWTAEQRNFFSRIWPEARRASAATGIPAETIFAQSALETGWGRSAPQNNYFGIKGAGGTQTTQEYINGAWTTIQDSFRGYSSLSESVSGYVEFINNPNSRRWTRAREASTPEMAAIALQQGGYATDPQYANKLISIMRGIPDELRNVATQQSNSDPQLSRPFTGVNPSTGALTLPDLPSVEDIWGGITGAAGNAVEQAQEAITDNPVTQGLEFIRDLFSQENLLRVILVLLGLGLIGLAAFALVSGKTVQEFIPQGAT